MLKLFRKFFIFLFSYPIISFPLGNKHWLSYCCCCIHYFGWKDETVISNVSFSAHCLSGVSFFFIESDCWFTDILRRQQSFTNVLFALNFCQFILNGIKVGVFFEKNIEKKQFCHHDQNYCYFRKWSIPVINLIVGSKNMIKISKSVNLEEIR